MPRIELELDKLVAAKSTGSDNKTTESTPGTNKDNLKQGEDAANNGADLGDGADEDDKGMHIFVSQASADSDQKDPASVS